ncbi:hypothetical protein KAT60_00725 [Candidatus Woesebacteria bacterium]|nr:hypothetical protein [Candidatus Woesebacteria bacterium]
MKNTRSNMKRIFSIFVFLSILVGLNLFVIYPYFFQDFPLWISSIEVGYITMGRWFAENFLRSWWLPQWYAGIPFHLVYVPLVPALTALVGNLIGNFGQGYHIVVGVAYVLVPVSLFFFLKKITKSNLAAFAGSFFFSVAPTFGLLFPGVRGALIDKIPLWRLIILAHYGEGPHTLAQVFLLPSALFAFKALDTKKFLHIFLASIFLALTALANSIGLFGGIILLGVIFFSWGLWKEDWGTAVVTGIKIFGLTFLLSAFWYNPSFILNDLVGTGQIGSGIFLFFPWRFLLFTALAFSLIYVLKRLIKTIEWGITILWFLVMFILLGGLYYFDISLVPQTVRFLVEFDMAGALVIALSVKDISAWAEKKYKLTKINPAIFLSLAIVLAAFGLFYNYAENVDRFMRYGNNKKLIEINQLREYELAQWLKENTNETDRIFVSANYTFWLNYFTDVWQLRGSHYFASTHPWPQHAGYQITAGEDGEISVMWAKIFNLRYLVVNPSNSLIHYQDYYYPQKFEGLLPKVGRIREDIIYEVSDLPGLARTVNSLAANNFGQPENAVDDDYLTKYLDWFEGGELLEFAKLTDDRYKIEGQVKQGEAIRIGLAYARGWKATDDSGNSVKVVKDPLGFILINPEKSGSISLAISYGLPVTVWVGILMTLGTAIYLVYKLVFLRNKVIE